MAQIVKRSPGALGTVAAVAVAAGTIIISAAVPPVRLVGVSAKANAVLIEASEPVAYAVSRPDPLTVLVDLRNVRVASPLPDVPGNGPVAGVAIEQTAAADGVSLARIRVSLTSPSEYRVRSALNTIHLELISAPVAPPAAPTMSPAPARIRGQSRALAPASVIEHVRARRTPSSTTITLSGDGELMPSSVIESTEGTRRLTLEFPGVTPRTRSHTAVDSLHVTDVRLAVSSREPLVTRAVLELGAGTTYHIDRSGPAGRDLDVVLVASGLSDRVMLAPESTVRNAGPADPPISMEQAMRNAASITSQTTMPPEPISTLDLTSAIAARGTGGVVEASRVQASPPAPVLEPLTGVPGTTIQQAGGTDGQKQFTGHPVSLDFQGADLRAVLRGFSEISGLNMVIDPDVQGTVDIILNEVPWDQALDVILRGNGLDYTVDGTIVRIARLESLRREQEARQALEKSSADAGTLAVRTFALSYARAAAAAPLIKKAALSARGDVQIDERTNTLIVTDLPGKLETAASLLATLDRAEPQVEVEARIVQTTRDFARAVGIQWGLNGRATPDIGNTTNLAFPNQGTIGGRLGTQGPLDPRATPLEQAGTAVALGAIDPTSAIGLALGAVNGAFNLDIALSALERSGKGRVLSTPRLTTQNNVEAEVAQGLQVPITTPGTVSQPATVSFKDAQLVLRVTPQITASNTVIMRISIENSAADFSRQVNGIPPINTQRASTQVQINDGATTIIGGIFISEEQSSNRRTPLLHRVPLLGWLFRSDSVTDSSRELLIFITPRILKG